MTLEQIKAATLAGKVVHWKNPAYIVIHVPATGQWLVRHQAGDCFGLTWADGVTMNGSESDFYVSGVDHA